MWQIHFGSWQIVLKNGILIPLAVMLPNILWMMFPGPSSFEGPVAEPLWLTLIENIGRLAVMLLPFFFVLDLERRLSIPVVVLMGISLALYYVCWARYFLGGRVDALLRAPLLGVPLPMAVFPVIFLLFSSYLMQSWAMVAAAIVFGAAHLVVSALGL